MSSEKNKLSGKDIATMVVAAVALALVIVVFVVIFTNNRDSKAASNVEQSSAFVVGSTVNDAGEIEFITMIEEYTDGTMSRTNTYTARRTSAKSTNKSDKKTTKANETVVVSVAQTDENGNAVTNADGSVVTVTVTKLKPTDTSSETTTKEVTTTTTTNRFGMNEEDVSKLKDRGNQLSTLFDDYSRAIDSATKKTETPTTAPTEFRTVIEAEF